MLGRLGYLFICFLWLLQSTEVLAVSKDKKPILIICSYNPAAHQTSVTISDYMDEYSKLGGQRDIVIENMNCKSFSEAPLWSAMMTQILAKYQGEKHPAQIILLGQEAWAAYLSQRDEMQVKVPVMCSLASSNVVILPEDTVESLDSWMPESVDHLLHASDAGIRAMADAGVVATLLPLTAFALKEPYARGREMIAVGGAVALATDLNPGSCFSGSIPLTIALACIYMQMSIEETITALTLNGAAALQRADRIGSIEVGKQGDFVILNSDNYHILPYYIGMNCVIMTIKGGILYPVA